MRWASNTNIRRASRRSTRREGESSIRSRALTTMMGPTRKERIRRRRRTRRRSTKTATAAAAAATVTERVGWSGGMCEAEVTSI